MRAGLDPPAKLLRDGWQPAEIMTRLALTYLDHKAEARSVRELERQAAKNKPKDLLRLGK